MRIFAVSSAKTIVFSAFILWSWALPGFSGPQNYEELMKFIADGKQDQIQRVEVVNGSSNIGLRLMGADRSVDVMVPEGHKKDLLRIFEKANVSLEVRDGPFAFPLLPGSHHEEPLIFSQMKNLLKEGKAAQIEKVYLSRGAILAVRMVGANRSRDVVCPLELKQDLVDELVRNGVTVEEEKPEKLNFFVIEIAFFLPLLILGTMFAFANRRRP